MSNIRLHESTIQFTIRTFAGSLLCLLIANPIQAQVFGTNTAYRFQYAAKIVCTANIPGTAQTSSSVLPGQYSTVVNIHNPHYKNIRLRRKVAVASGDVSKFIGDSLSDDQATKVDCRDIQDDYGPFIHGVEGFLVIESTDSLDVTAVYTAGGTGEQVESIDVEEVSERKLN